MKLYDVKYTKMHNYQLLEKYVSMKVIDTSLRRKRIIHFFQNLAYSVCLPRTVSVFETIIL